MLVSLIEVLAERYNKMLQTRRIVWNIIIGVIVVGVLSNFLYAGLIVER